MRLNPMFKRFLMPLSLIIIGMSMMTQAFALQEKTVKENGTVNALVSMKGITRIAVDNDRIANLRGPQSAYTIQNDNVQGAVFIQPINEYQTKPFTLFITTERNHNYMLRLTPQDKNADMILLKPVGVFNPTALAFEKSTAYLEAISALIHGMANGDMPEGYTQNTIENAKVQYLGNMASIQLKAIYSGAHLEGYVYQITNRTAGTLKLIENEFYETGVRAISLATLTLAPKAQTLLYKVKSHG